MFHRDFKNEKTDVRFSLINIPLEFAIAAEEGPGNMSASLIFFRAVRFLYSCVFFLWLINFTIMPFGLLFPVNSLCDISISSGSIST